MGVRDVLDPGPCGQPGLTGGWMLTGSAGDLGDVEGECGRPKMSKRALGHGDVKGRRLRCAKITRASDLRELMRSDLDPARRV